MKRVLYRKFSRHLGIQKNRKGIFAGKNRKLKKQTLYQQIPATINYELHILLTLAIGFSKIKTENQGV